MGSVGSLESLRMHWFPYFFYSGDLGSVGSPEMHSFPCIFHDLFSGVESVGNPESSRIIDLHNFSWFLRWSGKRVKPRIIQMCDFRTFCMISSVEWEAWEIQNHWKCIECIHLFIISSVEWEAWEAQNHCKGIDYHTFFMIYSVEWEAWEDQNHLKYVDFMRFQDFVRWSGKRGKPRITKNIVFFTFSKNKSVEWEAWEA